MKISVDSAINNISKATKNLGDIFTKLSSGKRINKASDDAAGLAIAEALASDTRVTSQANRNISDAVSVANIADSALSSTSDLVQRRSELAAQASNGTLNDQQRQSLDQEFQQLGQEIDRIAATTEFNGVNVLQGNNEIKIQAGSDSSSNSQISLQGGSLASSGGSIASLEGARTALDQAQTDLNSISQSRGDNGAVVNRLEVAQNNNSAKIENQAAAESRIRDADIAEQSALKIGEEIKQNGSAALLAQAQKLNSSTVLKLLG